mmetsp:Transcript_20662/g.57612  ORF Transcript_20662/g.57612 Transcript_20662/m.57612 type:complete len:317 (-) Transcript_20662:138-1088(-)
MLPMPSCSRARCGDAKRLRRHPLWRRLLLATAALAGASTLLLSGDQAGAFTIAASRGARNHRASGVSPRVASRAYTELSGTGGLAGFQGSEISLWTSFAVVLIALPGVWSTIQRTGQAKFVEKVYMMPGIGAGGLEMRAIAGGIVAYFKSLNYSMENSPQEGKIRFVGNLQGSLSQALYLTGVLGGAIISVGIVLQSLFPDGPFGLGPNAWFTPAITSPWAGWYYWSRAFRRDIVEMQLELSDDRQTTTLSTFGDQETIEALQRGVRFQSPEGKLFQLMERGMEYQPGIFEDQSSTIVYKQKDKSQQAPQPVTEAS